MIMHSSPVYTQEVKEKKKSCIMESPQQPIAGSRDAANNRGCLSPEPELGAGSTVEWADGCRLCLPFYF